MCLQKKKKNQESKSQGSGMMLGNEWSRGNGEKGGHQPATREWSEEL